MSEELCSVCGHLYDAHGSHSWCENKPCDCERIPIVDELQKIIDTLQIKLDEYEGENKRWHSFETVLAIIKERDKLQVKLDDAIYNFKRIKNSPRGMVGEDWFKMVANDALKKIDDIK